MSQSIHRFRLGINQSIVALRNITSQRDLQEAAMNLGNTLEHLAILRTLGSNPKDLNDFERWQIVVPKITWEPPPQVYLEWAIFSRPMSETF